MSPELEQKLADKYAFMRKGKQLDEQMQDGYVGDLYSAFGCECGDGWFHLIDQLCQSIQKTYCDNNLRPDITILQIKEKFGGLRFYASCGGSEKVHSAVFELIREAESKSETICEECGKPGSLRPGGWIQTLCDECYGKRHKK